MFDVNSDFALNKARKDAIVCKSVTGVHIELKQEDFSSKDEFLWWKKWSDNDYQEIETAGRNDSDCCSLNTELGGTGLSAEDELVAAQDKADADMAQRKTAQEMQDKVAAIRKILTKTQFRRLWMHHVDGLSMTEIAKREHVARQRINQSLLDAYKRIVNNL